MSSVILCQECKTEYRHNDKSVKSCPNCSSHYWTLVSSEDEESNSNSAQTSNKGIPITNRSATQNLKVVESLLSNLAGAKKYRRAIYDGEFASFSIIGTADWEDYASLSIDALQLLTLAQINENLEAIRKQLEGKEKD